VCVGVKLGTLEGATEGPFEGALLGVTDGTMEGSKLGTGDGTGVGSLLGMSVGTAVGRGSIRRYTNACPRAWFSSLYLPGKNHFVQSHAFVLPSYIFILSCLVQLLIPVILLMSLSLNPYPSEAIRSNSVLCMRTSSQYMIESKMPPCSGDKNW